MTNIVEQTLVHLEEGRPLRDAVLDSVRYRIRPIFRENTSGSWERALPDDALTLRQEIRRQPAQYVAQPRDEGAETFCFEKGKLAGHPQDHIESVMCL